MEHQRNSREFGREDTLQRSEPLVQVFARCKAQNCVLPHRCDGFGAECGLTMASCSSCMLMNSAGRILQECLLFCLCTVVILWTPAGSLLNQCRCFLILLSSSSIVLKSSTLQMPCNIGKKNLIYSCLGNHWEQQSNVYINCFAILFFS